MISDIVLDLKFYETGHGKKLAEFAITKGYHLSHERKDGLMIYQNNKMRHIENALYIPIEGWIVNAPDFPEILERAIYRLAKVLAVPFVHIVVDSGIATQDEILEMVKSHLNQY